MGKNELQEKMKMVDIDKLKEYKKNPKKHPATQINKLAKLIKEVGFIQPLVISKDNEIIIGHGRVKALKKLGWEKAPAVVKDDLTEVQIKKLRVGDNKIAESSWDIDRLADEIKEIDDLMIENDFDFELTTLGFDEKEVTQLIKLSENSEMLRGVIDDEKNKDANIGDGRDRDTSFLGDDISGVYDDDDKNHSLREKLNEDGKVKTGLGNIPQRKDREIQEGFEDKTFTSFSISLTLEARKWLNKILNEVKKRENLEAKREAVMFLAEQYEKENLL